MTQEFVPYEQALKLKQLGFDEPCLSIYDKDSVLQRSLLEYPIINSKNGFHEHWNITTAPLYQQAFRWFREKYKMAIINPDWNNKFKYKVFNLHLLTQGVLVEETGFQTYEEAELACLNKLIEIVESNTKEK